MKRKKIILFILAAILALITAFLIWNIFLKPQPQKEIIPVVEQESALSPVNRDEVKKPEESIQEDYKQETPKQKAVKKVTQKKPTVKPAPPEKLQETLPATNPVVQKTEEPEVQQEGVIVPVRYTSKNTYKYVYTPNRF